LVTVLGSIQSVKIEPVKKYLLWVFFALTLLSCKKNTNQDVIVVIYDKPLDVITTNHLNQVLTASCNASGIKGASCAVFVPSKGMWTGTFGYSHDQVKIKTSDYLTIGSNTKTFIAALILKLQEQGKVSIDHKVKDYLSNENIPYFDNNITIKQLLNHTSGLGDYVFNQNFDIAIQSDFNKIWKPREMYPYFLPAVASLGEGHNYSDQNYLIAGLVAEAVGKKPVEQSLRELILSPAQLKETFYYPFEGIDKVLPHGWSKDYGNGDLEDLQDNYGFVPVSYCSADNAAGVMISTAKDNAIFWDKLMKGQIFSPTSLNKMLEFVPVVASNGSDFYGLGIGKTINSMAGRTVYYHYGKVPGYLNVNAYEPISGIVISLQTNQDTNYNLEQILENLFNLVK